jgi:putative addiction module component (TIGR02574 family)
MSDLAQLTAAALALPPEQRFELAQQLWASIHDKVDEYLEIDEEAIAEAERRAAEMERGDDPGVSHEDVMKMLRK